MSSPPRKPYTLSDNSFSSLRAQCHDFARSYMSRFDSSHDYAHIQRVLRLSLRLAAVSPVPLNNHIVTLAALLHDVGDKKYSEENASPTPVKDYLVSVSAPTELAESVQIVVSNVSFSNESKDPEGVTSVLRVYPELAVVQDADRIDALGAVGIGRCFVFGGVKMPDNGMEGSIQHFGEKLVKLEKMMKTEAGREIAKERTRRVVEFSEWWMEEVAEEDEGEE
ncbi:hypothetical protein K440DRAFT_634981 [Wilcoxina mikolae CBS 423.85]|nr:hypothetical protein K440DRAFT_634981 [Wilcoxina mikolae CBS 423.85]